MRRLDCNQTYRDQHGFIALISVCVTSAILMVLLYAVGTATFYARFDVLGAENKRISLALAESCSNVALLSLARSIDPAGEYPATSSGLHQVVIVDTDSLGNPLTCTIEKIYKSGDDLFSIETQASHNGSFSNMIVHAIIPLAELPAVRVSVDSWEEVPQ